MRKSIINGRKGAKIRLMNNGYRVLANLGFQTLEEAKKNPPTTAHVLSIAGSGRKTIFMIQKLLGIKLQTKTTSQRRADAVSNADIVRIISGYVALLPAGRSFKGLCPFHTEKKPSFMVNRERGIFHCFGCEQGGDAARFVMLKEGLSFDEAIVHLEKLGRQNV